jgi:hypothetical protein
LHRNSRNVEIFRILGMLGCLLLSCRRAGGDSRRKDVGVL